MKKVTMLLLLLFAVMVGESRAEEPVVAANQLPKGRIRVKVLNVHSTQGTLGIALFNSKKGFPSKSEQALQRTLISAEGAEHVVIFDNVPYGQRGIDFPMIGIEDEFGYVSD